MRIRRFMAVNRYVCIHGHFYQPPRENPWLEEVELQDGAYPYHDWNEKITAECYRQNAASRILGPEKKIIDITNNYCGISSDFGPTLLSWLQRHAPDVYQSILDADKKSLQLYSGHGAVIAQAYSHVIMPLASLRDKYTQVVWGIRDFEYRFGRRPEGMWLPETAVDIETLEILAEKDIKFTILAPHQARRVRKIGTSQWKSVESAKIDTTQPYSCELPSGKKINLFFYNGPISRNVAYGDILRQGDAFARELVKVFPEDTKEPRLSHIADDGETYGHHHRYGDMALAYCLHYISSNKLASITVYGEFLEKCPPTWEAEIIENTSWSCGHGIERWRDNCGCNYGRFPSGSQKFRAPLREAMDWLRDQLAPIYEGMMAGLGADAWKARDGYIDVILDRSETSVERFFSRTAATPLTHEQKVTMLKLLEMQRHSLLMYASCGWFFDDITGIESIQVMRYAARAMQLAKDVSGKDLESGYMEILGKAPVNDNHYANGAEVYQARVQPGAIDLNRVGGHLAINSLFEEYPQSLDIYCFHANIEHYDRIEAGIQVLASGRAKLQNMLTMQEDNIDFTVLHFGDHNLIGAVTERLPDDTFFKMKSNLQKAFRKGDTTEVMRLMNVSFGENSYSLWHLFKDEQRRIMYQLLQSTWDEIEASLRHIYQHNYTIIQAMRGMNMPLPKVLSGAAEYIINHDLCQVIRDDRDDLQRLQTLIEEAKRLSLELDRTTLRFEAGRRIERSMDKLEKSPEDLNLIKHTEGSVRILLKIISEPDLQKAQNVLFSISKSTYPQMVQRSGQGEELAGKWIEHFKTLAQALEVNV